MFARFEDYDRTLSLMDELRRRMYRAWNDYDVEGDDTPSARAIWPRLNVFDADASIVIKADVPGMSEQSLELALNADSLSIAGERNNQAPEGYSAHRQERDTVKFARTLTLPCKVEADKVNASVKDGVLTITLPKAADARPRQIPIQGESKGAVS